MTTLPHIRPSDLISYRCPITQQWKAAVVSYCEVWGIVAVADSLLLRLEWNEMRLEWDEVYPPF